MSWAWGGFLIGLGLVVLAVLIPFAISHFAPPRAEPGAEAAAVASGTAGGAPAGLGNAPGA